MISPTILLKNNILHYHPQISILIISPLHPIILPLSPPRHYHNSISNPTPITTTTFIPTIATTYHHLSHHLPPLPLPPIPFLLPPPLLLPPSSTTDHHSPPLTTTHHHSPPLTTTHHHSPPLTTTQHHSIPLTTTHEFTVGFLIYSANFSAAKLRHFLLPNEQAEEKVSFLKKLVKSRGDFWVF